MPKIYHIVYLPAFSEHVFNCMATFPKEKRGRLNPTELKHFKTHKTMRRFVENEPMERLLLMLARMGHTAYLITAPEEYNVDALLAKITTQYDEPAAKTNIIEEMAKSGVHMTGTPEILLSAHMGMQNCHSQIYILNTEYYALKGDLEEMGKGFKDRGEMQKEAIEGFKSLAQLCLCLNNTKNLTEAICGLDEEHVMVLMALFINRHTFMNFDSICLYTGKLQQKMARNRINNLVDLGLALDKVMHPPNNKPTYKIWTITDKGIQVVMDYLKYFYNRAFKKYE